MRASSSRCPQVCQRSSPNPRACLLESTCSRHFLRPPGGLRLPTDGDPVLEAAMELLPRKHHCRGSVRLWPHLRVKPRQPSKTCTQPLSSTLPQVAQMDVEPSGSAGRWITLAPDTTPSLSRAPCCGEAAFPAQCWTQSLLNRTFRSQMVVPQLSYSSFTELVTHHPSEQRQR